ARPPPGRCAPAGPGATRASARPRARSRARSSIPRPRAGAGRLARAPPPAGCAAPRADRARARRPPCSARSGWRRSSTRSRSGPGRAPRRRAIRAPRHSPQVLLLEDVQVLDEVVEGHLGIDLAAVARERSHFFFLGLAEHREGGDVAVLLHL